MSSSLYNFQTKNMARIYHTRDFFPAACSNEAKKEEEEEKRNRRMFNIFLLI